MTTNPIDVLRERGFIDDITDEEGLREAFDTSTVTYYVGFDPTAESLHIGNLVGMMVMAHLQRGGHRPIAIAGGATGRIGDPSGRDAERELLDEDQLARNLAGTRAQLSKFIDLGGDPDDRDFSPGLLVDNYDWTRDVSFLEFLRDIGKHFSVNAMIAKESVKRRLEEREHGISFTEFAYQLLQAFDFAVLYERYGCTLQGGGSDQWGNITAGIDLTRKLHGGRVFGLTWPLIERSDGKKFGKSTGNAVWLDAELTSPYSYYQWFFNVPDADVVRFLKLFTFLPLDEIAELETSLQDNPGAREAHRALAREATRILHGDAAVEGAERAASILFGKEPFSGMDDRILADAFAEAPSVELERGRLDDGVGLLELLVDLGAASSNGEARRLVTQGGVRLNNAVVDDPTLQVTAEHLASPSMLVARVGKKRYYLAKFT